MRPSKTVVNGCLLDLRKTIHEPVGEWQLEQISCHLWAFQLVCSYVTSSQMDNEQTMIKLHVTIYSITDA